MLRVALLALPLALLAAPALAEVVQPNGLVVPVETPNGEQSLQSFFDERGEAIDAVDDASPTPDTFLPTTSFTATFVLNEAGGRAGAGWYNHDPVATEGPQVYEVVPVDSPLGTAVTGADILGDPAYAGGLIGFALLVDPVHYSEARFNTVCDAGDCADTPGPWILSLSYQSTATDDAWYLAFEDGSTTSSSWNNDGDYNDDVFFFTGLLRGDEDDDDCAQPDDDDDVVPDDDDSTLPDDDDSGAGPDDDDDFGPPDDTVNPFADDTAGGCDCQAAIAPAGTIGLFALVLAFGLRRRR